MAVFYNLFGIINRGSHTCAMATAAYRSGTKLDLRYIDEETDNEEVHTFDYSTKPGIAYSEIFAPSGAPDWVFDRECMWQKIENMASTADPLLAFEHTVALPEELSKEQNIELIKDLISESFTSRGIVADVNFHLEHANNAHLHILCPTRELAIAGDGEGRFTSQNEEWLSPETVKTILTEQAEVINKHLQKHGYNTAVSHQPERAPRYANMRPWL